MLLQSWNWNNWHYEIFLCSLLNLTRFYTNATFLLSCWGGVVLVDFCLYSKITNLTYLKILFNQSWHFITIFLGSEKSDGLELFFFNILIRSNAKIMPYCAVHLGYPIDAKTHFGKDHHPRNKVCCQMLKWIQIRII